MLAHFKHGGASSACFFSKEARLCGFHFRVFSLASHVHSTFEMNFNVLMERIQHFSTAILIEELTFAHSYVKKPPTGSNPAAKADKTHKICMKKKWDYCETCSY